MFAKKKADATKLARQNERIDLPVVHTIYYGTHSTNSNRSEFIKLLFLFKCVILVGAVLIMFIWAYLRKNNKRTIMIRRSQRDGKGKTRKYQDYVVGREYERATR